MIRYQVNRRKPNDYAQLIRMGRGWAIIRNSATLATTDYEHIGREIVAALNSAKPAPCSTLDAGPL